MVVEVDLKYKMGTTKSRSSAPIKFILRRFVQVKNIPQAKITLYKQKYPRSSENNIAKVQITS